jgi:hypothetical protein
MAWGMVPDGCMLASLAPSELEHPVQPPTMAE